MGKAKKRKIIKNKINKVLPKNKILRTSILAISAILIFFFVFFGFYSIIYSNKIYSNQFVGNINLSGKNKVQAEEIIKEQSTKFVNSGPLLISAGDKKFSIEPKDIGLSYDAKETANKIWQHGRNGHIFSNFFTQLSSLFTKNIHKSVIVVNEDALKDKISQIAKEVDLPEKDFSIFYQEDKFVLSTERQNGKRINQELALVHIKNHYYSLDKTELSLGLDSFEAQIQEENAKKKLADANKILSYGDLILTASGQVFEADSDNMAGFLSFNQKGNDLEIGFKNERIKLFVDSLAKTIDLDPKNAKLAVADGKAVVAESAQNGKTLTKDKTITLIQNALLERITASSKPENVALPVETKQPEVTNDIDKLGIAQLVGTAVTDFKGSPANRVHNITVGATSINGVLVKPGDVFSTLKQLGKIDESTGYLPELVIKEDRTVPEFGGGLCQVSSTLFRAALNAGVKITERQNHKYRVGYYEPPVGMDASIYDPSPDFKFVNNYGNYILIQSKIEKTKIVFELYGTKDARIVEISNPEITETVDPVPPIYVEIDTLPAGEKKQIEKAHQGATAKFTYKVTKDGQTLQDKTFTSKYVPWPEKWLVGKGSPAPTSTCSDGIKNGDEHGIDCGGSCPNACPV